MSVVLITGIQAAGKSTIAQALAEQLPRSVHIRGDLFRRMVVNGRAEMGPREPSAEAVSQLRLRYAIAAAVADRYSEAGFVAVMQDIILGDGLPEVIRLIQTRPLSVIVLIPDPDAVEARDRGRRLTRGKVAYRPGEQSVTALDRVLRHHTPRLGLWLDTTTWTVGQTVDTIIEGLNGPALVD